MYRIVTELSYIYIQKEDHGKTTDLRDSLQHLNANVTKFCGVYVAYLICIIPLLNQLLKQRRPRMQINNATSWCDSLFLVSLSLSLHVCMFIITLYIDLL